MLLLRIKQLITKEKNYKNPKGIKIQKIAHRQSHKWTFIYFIFMHIYFGFLFRKNEIIEWEPMKLWQKNTIQNMMNFFPSLLFCGLIDHIN